MIDRSMQLRFSLGETFSTPGAIEALKEAGQTPLEYLIRHQCGDWGDVSDEDKTENVQVVAPEGMPQNGHNTYVPKTGNRWVLNDTYPDKQRLQHPYVYDLKEGRRYPLGHFLSPAEYTGEWRCDTHPRASRNGRMVCIDSPHNGGRQLYLIDISGITT